MPTLQHKVPDSSPRSLIRREWRYQRVAQLERVAMPMQSLIQLRAVQHGLFEDFKKATEAPQRVSLAGALVKVMEARRVLLKIPAPGREPTPKERRLPPVVDIESLVD